MNGINISDNIVRLRHNKKITQEQLADFIGVTKAAVSKWENSQCIPDITVLPQLAAFFDVTVDELIGYTPQLSKKQIQILYQKFGRDFSDSDFEEVMEETKVYVKRYYSCYPFLLQICILWLNHCTLAESEKRKNEILTDIAEMCERIMENCKDIRIHSNALVLQGVVYMQTGKVQEVIDGLEDFSISNKYGNQSSVILAQAYGMSGDFEKAAGLLQISMYESISNLLANAMCYLSMQMGNSEVCEQTIHRIEQVAEIYNLADLNPNNLSAFEYQAAICCLTQGEKEKAVGHIEKYVDCLSKLFAAKELRLHGDEYFDKIEEWFHKELDNGVNAPRDRKLALEDARKTLDTPLFSALSGDPEFERLKRKLKELK